MRRVYVTELMESLREELEEQLKAIQVLYHPRL